MRMKDLLMFFLPSVRHCSRSSKTLPSGGWVGAFGTDPHGRRYLRESAEHQHDEPGSEPGHTEFDVERCGYGILHRSFGQQCCLWQGRADEGPAGWHEYGGIARFAAAGREYGWAIYGAQPEGQHSLHDLLYAGWHDRPGE